MTVPEKFSGTSTWTRSIGSIKTPSISFVITFGLEIAISYPSRRIASMRTARWSSPRPQTRIASSRPGISSIFSEIFALFLFLEPFAEFIHRDVLAVFADEWAGVDHEFNGNSRFSEGDGGELNNLGWIAEGVADFDLRDARKTTISPAPASSNSTFLSLSGLQS